MGSTSDLGHCEKIKKACATFGIPCELRVTSAHKGPDETLRIKAEYEGRCQRTNEWEWAVSCTKMTGQLKYLCKLFFFPEFFACWTQQ